MFTENGTIPIRFDLIEKLDNIDKIWKYLENKFNLPNIPIDKYHYNITSNSSLQINLQHKLYKNYH